MQSRTALLGAIVVAAAVLAAGIAGAVSPADVTNSRQSTGNETIEVAASGQVQAQADRAVIRVGIVTSADDVETVRERLSNNASSMREALVEAGIDRSQIRTARFDISSDRNPRGEDSRQPQYRGVHAFEITINETDRAGEVIDTAVSNGANEVDGVRFTLSPEKRQDLREQALRDAMDAARGDADAVAAQSGLTVAGVDHVSTTEYSRSPYQAEALAASADGASTSIDSGPVTVSASVTVVYDAETAN